RRHVVDPLDLDGEPVRDAPGEGDVLDVERRLELLNTIILRRDDLRNLGRVAKLAHAREAVLFGELLQVLVDEGVEVDADRISGPDADQVPAVEVGQELRRELRRPLVAREVVVVRLAVVAEEAGIGDRLRREYAERLLADRPDARDL